MTYSPFPELVVETPSGPITAVFTDGDHVHFTSRDDQAIAVNRVDYRASIHLNRREVENENQPNWYITGTLFVTRADGKDVTEAARSFLRITFAEFLGHWLDTDLGAKWALLDAGRKAALSELESASTDVAVAEEELKRLTERAADVRRETLHSLTVLGFVDDVQAPFVKAITGGWFDAPHQYELRNGLNRMVNEGQKIGLYSNHDLGHPEIGRPRFFGSNQFTDMDRTIGRWRDGFPVTLPDFPGEINWRYQLDAVYDLPEPFRFLILWPEHVHSEEAS